MTDIVPELSRAVKAEDIPKKGRVIPLRPSESELEAIATRLDLVALISFDGELKVQPEPGREISVRGVIRAQFTQNCVISGEIVTSDVEFELNRMFAEDADPFDGLGHDEEEIVDPDIDDSDPIIDGYIDVGEAAVEELALRIPPYPRAEGVEFDEVSFATDAQDEKENPFSVLESLKNKMNSDN